MVELELQPRAPWVRLFSAAQVTHTDVVGTSPDTGERGSSGSGMAKAGEDSPPNLPPHSVFSPLLHPCLTPSPFQHHLKRLGVCSGWSDSTNTGSGNPSKGKALPWTELGKRPVAFSCIGELSTSERQMCLLTGFRGAGYSWNATPGKIRV